MKNIIKKVGKAHLILIGICIVGGMLTALYNQNQKITKLENELEYYKMVKEEIVDTLNKSDYIVDGGTLEQGKFYRIHFNYEIDTKNPNGNWYEIYIDDDFSY